MGVEGEQQAADGPLDNLFGVDLLDVMLLQDAQDGGKGFQVLIGILLLLFADFRNSDGWCRDGQPGRAVGNSE